MGETAVFAMTEGEFFVWQEAQNDLYELVDGIPLQMMTGASNRHDRITVNIIIEAGTKLRGKSWRPVTRDTSIKISETQIRRPDVAIDCGPVIDKSYIANDPRAVFEVLSPSTRLFDQARKLEEYKSVSSLFYTVLIDPDSPALITFTRQADGGWTSRTIEGLEEEVDFSAIGFTLPLVEIYRDLSFRPKPMLVTPG